MIRFEQALPEDFEFAYSCICELEQQTFDQNQFKTIFNELSNSPQSFVYIIYRNNTPAGLVHLYIQYQMHHNGKVGEIVEFIVMPPYRNEGIGKAALDFIKKMALEQKCVLLELDSHKIREDAHRFYSSNGMQKSHFKFTLSLV